MGNIWYLLGFILFWVVLQKFILPRFGVNT